MTSGVHFSDLFLCRLMSSRAPTHLLQPRYIPRALSGTQNQQERHRTSRICSCAVAGTAYNVWKTLRPHPALGPKLAVSSQERWNHGEEGTAKPGATRVPWSQPGEWPLACIPSTSDGPRVLEQPKEELVSSDTDLRRAGSHSDTEASASCFCPSQAAVGGAWWAAVCLSHDPLGSPLHPIGQGQFAVLLGYLTAVLHSRVTAARQAAGYLPHQALHSSRNCYSWRTEGTRRGCGLEGRDPDAYLPAQHSQEPPRTPPTSVLTQDLVLSRPLD